MTPINWTPDRKTLAEFSEAGLFILGMVASPLAYHRGQTRLALTAWVVAVVIRVLGLIRPGWLRPIYLGLALATWPIGWALSRVALALLYFLIFAPIALLFRLIGRDALRKSADPSLNSYWEAYRPDRGSERYLRPF